MCLFAVACTVVVTATAADVSFTPFPPGVVKPRTWLRHQLELQANGLTGHAEELYDDIGKSDWLTHGTKGGQYAWERGPYYARGLFALAWALDDKRLKDKANRWVEAFLKWGREDGDFGPVKDSRWAAMPALYLLRDWHAVSGDPRSIEIVRRYAGYLTRTLPNRPLDKDSIFGKTPWARARGGDLLEILLDFHAATGEAVFMDAAKIVASQTAPWTAFYKTGAPDIAYQKHIVNFNEGMKTPAMMWRIFGDGSHKVAYDAATSRMGWAFKLAGRPDGMLNGEEPLSGRSSTGGTELCAITERIASCAVVAATFADARAAEDMEQIAYNCLPATLSPDGKGLRYYLLLNQPKCTNEKLGFANNGEGVGSIVPGPDSGYGCCRSNFHLAWPKFVQSMWMKAGKGYAAIAYGPCMLEDGDVKIIVRTDYPFRSRIEIEIVGGGGTFPLYLRIPGWSKEKDAGSFRKIERSWKEGDTVTLDFKSEAFVEKGWAGESAIVRKGPLLYAWPVPNNESVAGDMRCGFAARELHPSADFNMALDLEGGFSSETVDSGRPVVGQPFAPDAAPVRLRVKGVRTTDGGWGGFRDDLPGLAKDPPLSPVPCGGRRETLELLPLGCTQTRLTLLPWTTGSGEFCAPPHDGQVHASTLLPVNDGKDCLVAWFQGTKESADDVSICGSRRIGGTWEPVRVFAKVRNEAHWNPVLRRSDDGRIVLYFKVGRKIDVWKTYFCESRDEGVTWSKPQELVAGDETGGRGPVRNKCIRLKSGRWLAPASREIGPWRAFIDVSDDDGRTWRAAAEIEVPKVKGVEKFGVIQPSLWQSSDGKIHAFMRSNAGEIYRSESNDDGTTWSAAKSTGLPNNNSGIDLVRASDGKIYLAMNAASGNWATRSRLDVRVSDDDGHTWRVYKTLVNMPPGKSAWSGDEYSYPAIVELRPGVLGVVFTWNRKRIRLVEIPLESCDKKSVEPPPLVGDGVHDDTTAIQARLDSGASCVYLPPPKKCYLISKTLRLPSGTELRLDRFTVMRLAPGSDCPMIENSGYSGGFDRRIAITGGIWDMANVDQSPNPMSFGWFRPPRKSMLPHGHRNDFFWGMAMRFSNVEGLTFKGLTIRNPTTYGMALCKTSYFLVDDITFDYTTSNPYEGNMDGVHLDGLCHHGRISNLRGTCYDDMVALNANDGGCAQAQGAITDITIDGLYAGYCHSAVRMLSAGDKVERIVIRNVYGEFFAYAVGLTHYFPERPRGWMDDIVIENVFMGKSNYPESFRAPEAAGLYPPILVQDMLDIGSLSIRNLRRDERTVNVPTIVVERGARIENLSVRGCKQINRLGSPLKFYENLGVVVKEDIADNIEREIPLR